MKKKDLELKLEELELVHEALQNDVIALKMRLSDLEVRPTSYIYWGGYPTTVTPYPYQTTWGNYSTIVDSGTNTLT